MKDIFSSHFTADEGRRNKLWQNCFFVFDTNVLTSIYKRSDDAKDALLKIIISLGDRLWIPHQVIYELLDNRASIVHKQSEIYAATVKDFKSMLGQFKSPISHPFLSEDLYGEFLGVSDKVIAELESKQEFYTDRITNDDIKSAFFDLLTGKVGEPFTDEQIKSIIKEGESRYANNIPPGFKDVNKHKDSVVFSDVRKRYGDLIIWKQIIHKAKAVGKPVIFVTGEQKEDWWERCGGKTIGPLPRLIDEFTEETKQDFFIFSHYQFLSLANIYLEQTTSSAVIDEVRDSSIADKENAERLAELNHESLIKIGKYKEKIKELEVLFTNMIASPRVEPNFGIQYQMNEFAEHGDSQAGFDLFRSADDRIIDTHRSIGELEELIAAEEHLISWRESGE